MNEHLFLTKPTTTITTPITFCVLCSVKALLNEKKMSNVKIKCVIVIENCVEFIENDKKATHTPTHNERLLMTKKP